MTTKLVLLPGMDGTGHLFADFVRALPDTFEVKVVGYPGNLYLSYADLLPVVHAAVPPSELFVLLAESFSTPLAIQYAATKPANLNGIILCAGFSTSPVRGWKRLLATFLAPILFRLPLPDFANRHWLVGPGATSAILAAVRAAISRVQPKVLSARLRAILACDVRTALSQVTLPILYIEARQDRLVPVSCLEEILQINPRAVVVSIDGPHLILQREPQKAADVVNLFIGQFE